jgi:REP element-mobilizing transposase RayT
MFSKNKEKIFHITWVTYNSRVSERMIKYKIKKWEWIYFSDEQEILITLYIKDIVKKDKLKVLAYNICKDHIHMLLICKEDEISNIVRKLKWKSSQKYKKYLWINKEEKFSLWAQKYNNSFIETSDKFIETVKYIKNNRNKHELQTNKKLQCVINDMIYIYDETLLNKGL